MMYELTRRERTLLLEAVDNKWTDVRWSAHKEYADELYALRTKVRDMPIPDVV